MSRALRTLAIAVAVLTLLTPLTAAQSGGTCHRVLTPYTTISEDGGASFVPYRGRPPADYFLTWGLAATGVPGLVYRHAADTFWFSEDNGCNWTRLGPVAQGLYRIVAGPGQVAYAWPVNGGNIGFRLGPDEKGGTGITAAPRTLPASSLQGFGVDASDELHLRTAGRLGQLYESFDGGFTWRATGVQASPGGSIVPYFATFDPRDMDHAIYGQINEGGFVTFDGGANWTRSTGLSTGRANYFNGVISPVDGDVVYGMALDLEESQAGHPSGGRHIYVSTDGGLTYAPELDQGTGGVVLQNGPLMIADAASASVLHFVFSVRPVFGGTTFYRYDRAAGTLQLTANPGIPQVRSMAFTGETPPELLVGFEFVP